MREAFAGRRICQVSINLELMTAPIGPAGDALYLPLRITGGSVKGLGPDKAVLGGVDVAVIHADEKIAHCGRFIARDVAGDILFCYDGTSEATEGAYDDVLDHRLPGAIPSRLIVRTVSTNREWRSFNRRPLIGIGTFDAASGQLDVLIQAI